MRRSSVKDKLLQMKAKTEQSVRAGQGSGDILGHDDHKLEPGKVKETEFAFQIADRFVSIQETESGYDYSIMNMDYKKIEGGVYENTGVDIQEIANDIVDNLRDDLFSNGVGGSIGDDDEMIPDRKSVV